MIYDIVNSVPFGVAALIILSTGYMSLMFWAVTRSLDDR